jgi:hypothetical protein
LSLVVPASALPADPKAMAATVAANKPVHLLCMFSSL